MPNIKVRGTDNRVVEVDEEVAKCSNFIKNALERHGDASSEQVINLQNVNSEVFLTVMYWAEHHRNAPSPMEDDEIEDEQRPDEIVGFDADYFKVDPVAVLEILLAASCLDIKELFELACKQVAKMLKGKTTEDLRHLFSVSDDLTSMQKQQIQKENDWCEDK